jgi:hypothetical protein
LDAKSKILNVNITFLKVLKIVVFVVVKRKLIVRIVMELEMNAQLVVMVAKSPVPTVARMFPHYLMTCKARHDM